MKTTCEQTMKKYEALAFIKSLDSDYNTLDHLWYCLLELGHAKWYDRKSCIVIKFEASSSYFNRVHVSIIDYEDCV